MLNNMNLQMEDLNLLVLKADEAVERRRKANEETAQKTEKIRKMKIELSSLNKKKDDINNDLQSYRLDFF